MTLGGASWLGIKPPEVEPNPTLPFSQEEVQKLLSACDRYEGDKDRMRAFIVAMLYAGLRISDTCTLRRDAVRNGKTILRQAKTGQPVYLPVPPFVTEALDRVKGNGEFYFRSGKGKVLTIVGNWRKYLLERRGRAVGGCRQQRSDVIHRHPPAVPHLGGRIGKYEESRSACCRLPGGRRCSVEVWWQHRLTGCDRSSKGISAVLDCPGDARKRGDGFRQSFDCAIAAFRSRPEGMTIENSRLSPTLACAG